MSFVCVCVHVHVYVYVYVRVRRAERDRRRERERDLSSFSCSLSLFLAFCPPLPDIESHPEIPLRSMSEVGEGLRDQCVSSGVVPPNVLVSRLCACVSLTLLSLFSSL